MEDLLNGISEALSTGKIFVTFIKADGSKREMTCTTDSTMIPSEFLSEDSDEDHVYNTDLYKVFDLNLQAWRSFRGNRVISWNKI